MKKQIHSNTKMEEIPKDGMFKVPDGYFENLTDRVMKVAKTGPIEARTARINPYFSRRLLRVAAAIAGFIILSFAGYHIFHKTHNSVLLSQTDAYNIAVSYATEFDENTLIINMLESEQASNSESEAVINFLVDEDIDEITLLQEL